MIVKREFYKLKTKKFAKSGNSEFEDFDEEFYNDVDNYNFKADNDHELRLTEGIIQIFEEIDDVYIAETEVLYLENILFNNDNIIP